MSDPLPDPVSFEDALKKLELIVRSLETGQGTLEMSLKNYEEGIKLLRFCHATLQNAEQKIEILRGFDKNGNLDKEIADENDFSTDTELFHPKSAKKVTIIRKKRVQKSTPAIEIPEEEARLFDSEDE